VPAERPKDDKTDFEHALEEVEAEKDAGTPPKKEKGPFKCDYPGCNFESTAKIGLFQHKRTHRTEEVKQEAVKGISK